MPLLAVQIHHESVSLPPDCLLRLTCWPVPQELPGSEMFAGQAGKHCMFQTCMSNCSPGCARGFSDLCPCPALCFLLHACHCWNVFAPQLMATQLARALNFRIISDYIFLYLIFKLSTNSILSTFKTYPESNHISAPPLLPCTPSHCFSSDYFRSHLICFTPLTLRALVYC